MVIHISFFLGGNCSFSTEHGRKDLLIFAGGGIWEVGK
jgi:hypothetical protein